MIISQVFFFFDLALTPIYCNCCLVNYVISFCLYFVKGGSPCFSLSHFFFFLHEYCSLTLTQVSSEGLPYIKHMDHV